MPPKPLQYLAFAYLASLARTPAPVSHCVLARLTLALSLKCATLWCDLLCCSLSLECPPQILSQLAP